MTRTALIALSVIAVLLAGIAHVNASGKQAADATIAELEARIVALEAVAIVPRDIPISPDLLPPGVDPENVDPWDLVPGDPALSVDFVCYSKPTSVGGNISGNEGVIIPNLQSLSCARYIRVMPFPPADIDFYD